MTTRTVSLLEPDNHATTRWSGGTTTQLAIYPPRAQYPEKTFGWRISTAMIETDTSQFTALPGIERVLMMIDGHLVLEHEGYYRADLFPFDQDTFSGSWPTSSYGRGVDLNLMLRHPYGGQMIRWTAPTANWGDGETPDWVFFYPIDVALRIVTDGEGKEVQPRDLLMIHTGIGRDAMECCIETLNHRPLSEVNLIQISIWDKRNRDE